MSMKPLDAGQDPTHQQSKGKSVRGVRRVVEHRLLTADSLVHLGELTDALTRIGWHEYGGPIVLMPDGQNGLLRQVFTQQMVLYSAEVLT